MAKTTTTAAAAVAAGDLGELITSWHRSLRAGRRSPKTTGGYLHAAEGLARFLAEAGMPTAVASIRREHVEAYLVDLMATRSASTAATRYRALRQLFRWLDDEGEITTSPMSSNAPFGGAESGGRRAPRLDTSPAFALLYINRN